MTQFSVEKQDIDSLLAAILKAHGYDFRHYAQASLKRRVSDFLETTSFQSCHELQQALIEDRKQFRDFLLFMSLTTTELFKDPDFYTVLKQKVLPTLQTYPYIKIWLAGCATGEEAYSMAILLHEADYLKRTTIYATDFNQEAINIAKQGAYASDALKQYDENYRQAGGTKSFSDYYHANGNTLQMHDFLKDRITWSDHNLVTDAVFGEMNLIVCRNVLIYFDTVLQNQVVELFNDSLCHRGFLCLGAKESLEHSSIAEAFESIDDKEKIYRKKLNSQKEQALPEKTQAEPLKPKETKDDPPAIIPKILIVDDDERNLLALETILKKTQADIVRSTSGEHALACLIQEEFALILLDVQMPGMDGFETATLLRQNNRLKKIPIIFVTAISKEERYIQKGHEVGAVDYLLKPIDPIILLSKVHVFLDYYIQDKKMQQLIDQLACAQDSLAQSNEELQKLARFDTVTGLANRRDFNDMLASTLAAAKKHRSLMAVLFLDLDNFKQVNDTYGHQAGDTLLKQVAARLGDSLRKGDLLQRTQDDNLVSRFGGDEFAIILSSIKEPKNIALVAQRIIDSLNQPFDLGHTIEASIGVSIGIACYPFAGETAEELCKNADMAMYQAKQAGKNTYRYFSEELNTAHLHHLIVEKGLREALKKQQFYLVYQPILSLETKKTVGVEVLCRCASKNLKNVSPQECVQMAEDTGLMPELGAWIFSTAVAEAESLLLPIDNQLSIHINLSTTQLHNDTFLKLIEQTYQQPGITPKNFIFELTETAIMSDTQLLTQQLTQIANYGSSISIDDFGTGYSSLTWLQQLPISSLKIDRVFVNDVATNTNNAAITRSVISLAKNLELTSIAEGIETKAELDFLKKHHCPMGQGYYFSKPLIVSDFAAYLKKEKRP